MHIHIYTHAHSYIHAHIDTYTHSRTHTDTYIHSRTHTYTHTDMHTHAHTHTHTFTHSLSHTHAYTRTSTHSRVFWRVRLPCSGRTAWSMEKQRPSQQSLQLRLLGLRVATRTDEANGAGALVCCWFPGADVASTLAIAFAQQDSGQHIRRRRAKPLKNLSLVLQTARPGPPPRRLRVFPAAPEQFGTGVCSSSSRPESCLTQLLVWLAVLLGLGVNKARMNKCPVLARDDVSSSKVTRFLLCWPFCG